MIRTKRVRRLRKAVVRVVRSANQRRSRSALKWGNGHHVLGRRGASFVSIVVRLRDGGWDILLILMRERLYGFDNAVNVFALKLAGIAGARAVRVAGANGVERCAGAGGN